LLIIQQSPHGCYLSWLINLADNGSVIPSWMPFIPVNLFSFQ